MRDPRTITEQLDSLVSSAEETERGVRDMEELLGIEQDGLLPSLDDDDIELEAEAVPPAGRPPARETQPPVRIPPLPGPASDVPPPRKKITH